MWGLGEPVGVGRLYVQILLSAEVTTMITIILWPCLRGGLRGYPTPFAPSACPPP